jgi:hypothetical protein
MHHPKDTSIFHLLAHAIIFISLSKVKPKGYFLIPLRKKYENLKKPLIISCVVFFYWH